MCLFASDLGKALIQDRNCINVKAVTFQHLPAGGIYALLFLSNLTSGMVFKSFLKNTFSVPVGKMCPVFVEPIRWPTFCRWLYSIKKDARIFEIDQNGNIIILLAKNFHRLECTTFFFLSLIHLSSVCLGIWQCKDSPQQQLQPLWEVHTSQLPGEWSGPGVSVTSVLHCVIKCVKSLAAHPVVYSFFQNLCI